MLCEVIALLYIIVISRVQIYIVYTHFIVFKHKKALIICYMYTAHIKIVT